MPSVRVQEAVLPTRWSHWTVIEGGRVHYVDTDPQGPAEALFIVHGFLGSTIPFEPFIDVIRTRRRVVMPDLPGCGYSSAPRGAGSLEFYLGFLEQFSAQLGLRQVVLMGSSAGSQLSVRYAAEHGGQLSALVLCSPFGLAEQQKNGRMRLARSEVLLRLAAPWVSRERVRRTLVNVVADDSLVDSRLVDSFWAPFRTAAGRRVASQLLSRVAMRQPLDPLLARLSLPVLVLFGKEDPLSPPGCGARFSELLPGSRVVLVSGVGHMPHVEAPGEVARNIEAFLAEKAD
jgi:pimeloyl-ACP methyl ester carboxylesterase